MHRFYPWEKSATLYVILGSQKCVLVAWQVEQAMPFNFLKFFEQSCKASIKSAKKCPATWDKKCWDKEKLDCTLINWPSRWPMYGSWQKSWWVYISVWDEVKKASPSTIVTENSKRTQVGQLVRQYDPKILAREREIFTWINGLISNTDSSSGESSIAA